MDVLEAIRTTRSMRRLDPARAVSEEDLRTVLEAATRGATGGNSQPVRWLVVREPTLRQRLGEIYQKQAQVALKRYEEIARTDPQAARMLRSAQHLADHMGEAPVLLLPCARGERGFVEASVYPGVQNLMLAARALGLGTTLTTIHRRDEESVKRVLGIPEDVHTFCLIPLGHPLGRWGEGPRRSLEEVVYWDSWKSSS
jgi:nitroreductase